MTRGAPNGYSPPQDRSDPSVYSRVTRRPSIKIYNWRTDTGQERGRKMANTSHHQARRITHPEFTENVIWNDRAIDSIRSTCSCLSGSLTGIIGLTNFSGLSFYLASFTITNLIILLVNYLRLILGYSSIQPVKNQSTFQNLAENLKFSYAFWISGLIDNSFGFILWWTLFYGLIHIYD
ncbi:hypothetical protein PTTG_03536 [Puccinia triticina 1-1 BBBD Race 1]|uniref:ER membrane protein complex subunit 6 n=1 Tax=Puccinia triticina (isolate 1-1 / race 1 (BBBD)) TaxID=630390 RepID=A0A180GVJ5_PUCT1|nr:hypothetical protein PTTG_03536 [Puccinia triticina 1-1 BBBD Race 1]